MKRLSRLKHHSDDVPKLIITKIFYLPVFLCGYQGRVEKKGKEHDKSWLSPYKGGRMKEPVKERCEQGTVCI